MIKINYSVIKVGDRVDYSGSKFNPISIGIRIFSAGIKNAFNIKIPTHTAIVCSMNDQLLTCGMRNKISIESLENKEIIGIYRHPAITDEAREIINKNISYDVRKSLDYDYEGICSFITKYIKENPNHFYCSEYYKYLTLVWIPFKIVAYSPYTFLLDSHWERIC